MTYEVENINIDGWVETKTFYFPDKITISHNDTYINSFSKYNISSIIEPPEIYNPNISDLVDFDLVLTWREDIISSLENSKLFTFGTSWIKNPEFDKINLISYLTSSKVITQNHRFRHEVYDLLRGIYNENMAIQTHMSPPRIDRVETVLNPSMFFVTIENSCYKNLFTEKIVNCFMTKTIPIYYGCPNIGDFFDTDGILTFNNKKELIDIVQNIDENDYYSRIDSIEKNYILAHSHADYFDNIYNYINKYFYGEQ
jgi:hypothetical protein